MADARVSGDGLRALALLARKSIAVARGMAVLRWHGTTFGSRPQLHGRVVVKARGAMEVGGRLVVHGRPLPTKFTVGRHGRLTIGARAFFNYGVDVNAQVGISIGDNVRVGPLVSIADDDMHEIVPSTRRRAPIIIGDNVWIGRGAAIAPGVTIDDHAVVGANSVVTKDVPAATVVSGVPARVIRTIEVPLDWRRA